MIYKKKLKKIQGLWCRADNKFYYLETGEHSIRNPLDRIKTTLRMRDLIPSEFGRDRGDEPLIRMTADVAKQRGYEIVPVYLNNLVKQVCEESKKEESTRPKIWGRRD